MIECPDCDARMVERTNSRTGETFWGCSTYPDCKCNRQSAPIDDGEIPDLPSMRTSRNDRRRWES